MSGLPFLEHQTTRTFTHADGAVMTYDILGTQHLGTGNRTPIVLMGGMSFVRSDWEHLANALSAVRPVLLLDHRGIGDSTYSTKGDEKITIELYARDILDLLIHLRWKKVALCGYSLGGAVVQQLLLLPYHSINPTPPHPFTITHVFLTSTFTSPLRQKLLTPDVSRGPAGAGTRQWTKEELKEIARPAVELSLDETWLVDPKNRRRYELILDRMTVKRPLTTIFQQGRASNNLNFNAPRSLISPTIQILVIHGQNDQITPFSCSQEILKLIPHAQFVSVGPNRGQVPNLKFGHMWYEYFDARVWADVFEMFMREEGTVETRL